MNKTNQGFSLIETLVVITIFAVLAIVSTQATIVTLLNSRKAESSVRTRESLQYVSEVVERHLRNSQSITQAVNNRIDFVDQDGVANALTCSNATPDSTTGQVLLNSDRISSEDITVTNCNFSSVTGVGEVPDRVMLSISGQAINLSDAEQTPITISSIIYLRVY